MTPENQRRALAELDGYVDIEAEHRRGSVLNPSGWMIGRIEASCCDGKIDVPNYLASLDAIIPLIQKQPEHIWNLINDELGELKCCYRWLCNPSDYCEALLRASGKWVE